MKPAGDDDGIVARRSGAESSLASWFKPLSVGTLLSLLGLAAVMLVWRRLAGALHEPLELPAMAITACVLVATGSAVRLLWAGNLARHAPGRSWHDRLILLTPTAAILAAGFSLSVPGTSAAGLAVLWSLIAAEEIYSLVLRVSFRPSTTVVKTAAVLPTAPETEETLSKTQLSAAGLTADLTVGLDAAPLHNTADGVVTQQLVRVTDRDGAESMSGLLVANFLAGQRTATVHIAFCPPFSAMPKMEFEQVDGPSGKIKIVQLLPYGARFDIKLSKNAEEPLGVSLRFSARS